MDVPLLCLFGAEILSRNRKDLSDQEGPRLNALGRSRRALLCAGKALSIRENVRDTKLNEQSAEHAPEISRSIDNAGEQGFPSPLAANA